MSADPSASDPLLRAVRRHLDQESARVDAAQVLAQVKQKQADARGVQVRLKWTATAALLTSVAALVLLMFYLGGGPAPQMASASDLLTAAQQTHSSPLDRQYELLVEWEPGPLRANRIEPLFRKTTIWTRGDQFTQESTNLAGDRVVWGQNQAGEFWIALNRKRGLVYGPDEVGEPLMRHADLVSLRLVTLLSELLQQYDLYRKDQGRPGESIRIEADLRPRPDRPLPRFREVELELDPENKSIRQAVLKRMLNGELISTLRFKLLQSATQPEQAYELRSHLDADGMILDGKAGPRNDPRAKFRDEFLKRWQSKFKP